MERTRSIIALNLNKPLFTRQGHPVRILATDVCGYRTYRPNWFPYSEFSQQRELRKDLIIGLVRKPDGTDETRRWTPEGLELNEDTKHDLVQPKVKKWRWVFYNMGYGVQMSKDRLSEEEARNQVKAGYWRAIEGRILESEIEE